MDQYILRDQFYTTLFGSLKKRLLSDEGTSRFIEMIEETRGLDLEEESRMQLYIHKILLQLPEEFQSKLLNRIQLISKLKSKRFENIHQLRSSEHEESIAQLEHQKVIRTYSFRGISVNFLTYL